jgi:ferrochelatase
MSLGVITVNFGEPASPSLEEVTAFLERIFLVNAALEPSADEAAKRSRSRELAEGRAPGLIEEYRLIGASPNNPQADAQAAALGEELTRRGVAAKVYSAFQFTPPLVADVVRVAKEDGIRELVGVPVYPLCGPSTNVAALDAVRSALDAQRWNVSFWGVTGWHRHPLYLDLRADAIRKLVRRNGVDLQDPDTLVIFSAHGTPKKYLDAGSRYVEYVEEFCREIAGRVGLSRYEIGYQNHTNRRIEWTAPGVGDVVKSTNAKRVVVDPVSFMHEQSETLAELDHELREEAEGVGLEFHRVPVPHDDPRFAPVLADMVEAARGGRGGVRSELPAVGVCRCRPSGDTYCMNALSRGVGAAR